MTEYSEELEVMSDGDLLREHAKFYAKSEAPEWQAFNRRLLEIAAKLDAWGKNPWQEAVIEALVVDCIYENKHDTNPIKALNDLIQWEHKIALDPAVSAEARALVEQGIAIGKSGAVDKPE